MTPERMRGIREAMYLPMRAFARLVDRSAGSLREMEDGIRPTPRALAEWLESLERWQKNNPPSPKSR